MKCPHCGTGIHANWVEDNLTRSGAIIGWKYTTAHCPECEKYTIAIKNYDGLRWHPWKMVHPLGANRGPVPESVPPEISVDYIEACGVMPISPKASAALSRRCLQNVLRAHGYKERDLAKEIDALLGESDPAKAIPQSLRDVIDSIRNFGNFSAHPINDLTSLQVIEVDPEEAEWCLEILEEMFQHFYERPAQAAIRKAALNAKLAAAGKPPAK